MENLNQEDRKKAIKETVGLYKLDIHKSNFCLDVKDSSELKDIFLEIRQNGNFYLTRKIIGLSSFEDTTGNWFIDGYNIDKFLVLRFPNSHFTGFFGSG